MNALQRLSVTPHGVRLGPLELVPDHGARNFVLEIGGRPFHGFVVRHGQCIRGYVDRCPHMGLPLAKSLDDYLSPSRDLIACGWHGALFRIGDGVCVGGPCVGEALSAWPLVARDGMIETAAAQGEATVGPFILPRVRKAAQIVGRPGARPWVDHRPLAAGQKKGPTPDAGGASPTRNACMLLREFEGLCPCKFGSSEVAERSQAAGLEFLANGRRRGRD